MRTITRRELRLVLTRAWLFGYDHGFDDQPFRDSMPEQSKYARLCKDCDDLLNALGRAADLLEPESPVEVQGVGDAEISAPAASHALPEGTGR